MDDDSGGMIWSQAGGYDQVPQQGLLSRFFSNPANRQGLLSAAQALINPQNAGQGVLGSLSNAALSFAQGQDAFGAKQQQQLLSQSVLDQHLAQTQGLLEKQKRQQEIWQEWQRRRQQPSQQPEPQNTWGNGYNTPNSPGATPMIGGSGSQGNVPMIGGGYMQNPAQKKTPWGF